MRGKIPPHQGAIAYAKVALQYRNDPGVHTLVQQVFIAQEGEHAMINNWLGQPGPQHAVERYDLRRALQW